MIVYRVIFSMIWTLYFLVSIPEMVYISTDRFLPITDRIVYVFICLSFLIAAVVGWYEVMVYLLV